MGHAGSHQGRVRARRCAVQALYQWIITGTSPESIVAEFVAERELIKVDVDYFAQLSREIPRHYEALLADIECAIDREWLRIDPVERAVLLLSTYELRHCPQIPWRVVVNEGVELSKMFGADEAHRYINGVLDKIAQLTRQTEISGVSPVDS